MKPHVHIHHRLAAPCVAVALALTLVACGGDDSTSSAAEPAVTESSAPAAPLSLPTKRSDITPTAGDLPNGVYRLKADVATLLAADPTGTYTADDESILEFVLKDGTAEVHYFEMDSTPQEGEPPSTGGVYEVRGDQMIFATPPERAIPGTTGVYVLRWSLDGDTLTLEQIDDGKVDADFVAPWVRVGDAP